MKTRNAAVAGRRSGLTLIEVLATVFVLGMGLIMVGAAFPVGVDQMRRTKDDTNAAELARSALDMIRAQNFAQSATAPAGAGFSGGSGPAFTMLDMSLAPVPPALQGMACCDPSAALSASWVSDLVSNPNALAYGRYGMYSSSNVIFGTIANNTLVCIPVLTRMVLPQMEPTAARPDGAGVPLYRVTLVVVKKTAQPDLANMNGGPHLPFYARMSVPSSTGNTIPGYGSTWGGDDCEKVAYNVNVDDGVLVSYGAPTVSINGIQKTDYRTGAVYRIVDRQPLGYASILTLDDSPGITNNTECIVFFNYVAAYYAYIGG